MRRNASLALIVILLLVQFGLRVHNPLAMAAFWDENSHISRARALFNFEQSPIANSHGKLLLYFWLGAFQPGEHVGALVVSRWAVALFSLLGSAGMMAAARLLFGRQAMIPALAFYTLAPWSLFFDRMAFADPFTGALAALAAWQSLWLVRIPTPRQGVIVGLLVALAALAKLTTAVIACLPILAILLFTAKKNESFFQYFSGVKKLWRRYRTALIAAGIAAAVPWLIVLGAGAWLAAIEGEKTILVDTYLIGDNTRAGGILDRLQNTFITKTDLLLSPGMTILLAMLVILQLWKRPAPTLYALAWLLAIWGPVTLVATELQSRYLSAGIPALAAIFGGGMVVAGERLARISRLNPLSTRGEGTSTPFDSPCMRGEVSLITYGLAFVILSLWAITFAIPFAQKATSDPVALEMPYLDTTNYFSGTFTTWATRDALADLAETGERVEGKIPLVGVLRVCEVHELMMPDGFAWDCMPSTDFLDQKVPRDTTTWTALVRNVERYPFVYVMTDYLAPDQPPATLAWQLVAAYPRPHGTNVVTVWRVSKSSGDVNETHSSETQIGP